jgi:dCTP deaminase
MILSGQTIRTLCDGSRGDKMLQPFSERTRLHGMTYGLGPAGYDVRAEFDAIGAIDTYDIECGEFLLCSTIERFQMPTNVMGIVHDKSTLARLGIAVQNTVIEPGWGGWLTLELTNHGPKTVRLTRGMPIAQIIFHETDQVVEKSYDGKYHNQERGPVEAKLEK